MSDICKPPLLSLWVISFSSIKLTVVVTQDESYYHDNRGADGRGVQGTKSVQGKLSHKTTES